MWQLQTFGKKMTAGTLLSVASLRELCWESHVRRLSLSMKTCPDHLTARRFPVILGWGASLAVAQGVFDYTGGKFSGYDKDPNVDEYERKMALRATTRHPIQETIDTLGEGRGELSSGLL